MASGLGILLIGFLLGMRHATDPDHVVAVSTIVSRERSILKASWIGILWGIGHTVTILAMGAAIILFGFAVPPRLGLSLEFSVGLMLILLGALNLSGGAQWMREKLSPAHSPVVGRHAHIHQHENHLHFHWHSHSAGGEHHAQSLSPSPAIKRSLARLGLYQTLRPLAVGLVHGLAGSAAVALLVLSTIRDPKWAVGYLLVFGVGTIAGMMLITSALALPFSLAAYKFAWLHRGLITGSGVLSLGFGLFVCYHIGYVEGLFRAIPSWTPS